MNEKSISQIVDDVASMNVIDVKPDTNDPSGLDLAERIYYICGWALNAGSKQKNQSIPYASSHLSSTLPVPDMPTNLVTKTQSYGGLRYAKEPFYTFYCFLEKICSEVLTNQNIIIYGNQLLQQCRVEILASNKLQTLFDQLISDDYQNFEMEDPSSVFTYFVNIFTTMRGKDYCKRYMGDKGRSLTHGLHPSLDVITKENQKKLKQKTKKKSESEMEVEIESATETTTLPALLPASLPASIPETEIVNQYGHAIMMTPATVSMPQTAI